MDRCALFVDASYVLADGAMAVHGTRRGESVSWDYEGLLQLLSDLARERAGLPVLRDAPLAPWPEWLRIQLLSPQRPVASRATVPDRHALARLVRLVAGAREGERNGLTYWAACRAGEMVATGLFDADAAVALIAEAATRAGLPRAEAERTGRSGIERGRSRTHA